jgi:hypothetical protein
MLSDDPDTIEGTLISALGGFEDAGHREEG